MENDTCPSQNSGGTLSHFGDHAAVQREGRNQHRTAHRNGRSKIQAAGDDYSNDRDALRGTGKPHKPDGQLGHDQAKATPG